MENDNTKNHQIDFDELEEMPDVVYGEETRVMKVIHDREKKGTAANPNPVPVSKDTFKMPAMNPNEKKKEESNAEDLFKDLPSADEVKEQDISEVMPTMKHANPIEEIPDSITDDDPGVNDELSEVYAQENTDKIEKVADPMDALIQHAKAAIPEYEKKESEPAMRHASSQTNEIPVNEVKIKDELEEIYPEEDTQDTEKTEKTVKEAEVKKTAKVDIDVPPRDVDPDNDTVAMLIENRKTPMKQKVITVLIILLLCALGFGGFQVYKGFQPVQSNSEEVAYEVVNGDTLQTTADKLKEDGIISNSQISYWYARFKGLTDIKVGTFKLDKSWSIEQIFTFLNDSKNAGSDYVSVTIVEGDWAKDAATKIAAQTNVSYDDLIALWNNRDWITSEMSKYPFLTEDMFKDGVRIYMEGYLAPETYYFDANTTAEAVTEKILDQTLTVYNKYADQIAASGRSIADIYTMASIIQYEAGSKVDDLKNVAGVFYNRLAANMPLQSSVTVCYAIDFDKQTDNWQACEMNSTYDSPYNTYQNQGLPPGPIENAGEAAIEAAINPASNNYYYFMADVYGDGTIYYAETLEEHNANVAKYLEQ